MKKPAPPKAVKPLGKTTFFGSSEHPKGAKKIQSRAQKPSRLKREGFLFRKRAKLAWKSE
jgi:hypothetical protein